MNYRTDDLIDRETTNMLLDTLEDEFYGLIDEFIKSGDTLSAKIRQVIDNGQCDIDTLIILTHTLKGASGNIGATVLSSICETLELRLRNKQEDGLPERVSELEQIYSDTRSEYLRMLKKAS